jgi:hypothetical protein
MELEKEYKNNKEKIKDFCIGFFGINFFVYILSIPLMIIGFFLSKSSLAPILSTKKFQFVPIILLLIIYIGLSLFFRKRRKYISIGISCFIISGMFLGILIGLGAR